MELPKALTEAERAAICGNWRAPTEAERAASKAADAERYRSCADDGPDWYPGYFEASEPEPTPTDLALLSTCGRLTVIELDWLNGPESTPEQRRRERIWEGKGMCHGASTP